MNFQRLTSLFPKADVQKKTRSTSHKIDKWYEYSSMNDLHNPSLREMKNLKKTMNNTPKKKTGSA